MAKPDLNSDEAYPIHTGQEAKAMLQALSDGKTGRDWQSISGADIRVHKAGGARHRVQIDLTEDERLEGFSLIQLEGATVKLDADYNFMLLYISERLTPVQALAANAHAGATIDLDDAITAAGWVCRSGEERQQMRRNVWNFIKFISRAIIVGERSGRYFDRVTRKEVETRIESPAWSIQDLRFAETGPPSPFTNKDEVPLTVRLVASREWTFFTTSQNLAQYLPFGEVLGAIPSGRAAGAWAKVIGLALCDFWRRNAREDRHQPTRRELLEFCTPSTGSAADVLNSSDPRRAIQYWTNALRILVERNFLEDSGEAALTYEAQRDALGRQDWQRSWFNGKIDLTPGPAMGATLAEISGKQIKAKPVDLKKPGRGRPRKKST